MAKRTEVEDELLRQIKWAKLPEPTREYRAVPSRRFRWDFFWGPDTPTTRFMANGLLVEIHGAVWVKGGHNTGVGVTRDAEKLTLATLNGFWSMSFTTDQVKNGSALVALQEFLKERK